MSSIEPEKTKKSFWDIFKNKPEQELEEEHNLSDKDVEKGKKSGKINGDPVISFE